MTEDTVAQSASSHAASLVQKLAARQAQICSEREERQQQLQSEADPREDVTRFLSNWSAERDRLQVQCSTLQQQAAAPLAEAAKHSLLQQLEDVSSSISKREQATADAAYFLPPYELRSCTAHLQELRAQAAAVKQQLQPKRKFAFSKAVCRKPAADVAALTAAIVGTDLKQHVTRTADQSAVATAAAAAGTAAGQSAVPAVQPVVPPPSLQDLQLIASGQGLTGLRGKTVTKTTDQLTAGQAFVLHDLQDCTVFLLGRLSALRLQQLQRCRVYAGPVAGATFINGASNCTLMVASHQVRIHDAVSNDLYLRLRSHPIIEHSSGLRFAPFPIEQLLEQQEPLQGSIQQQQCQEHLQPVVQEQQEQQCQQQQCLQQQCQLLLHAQLNIENDLWEHVHDFGWVKASQSPNWSVLPAAERQQAVLPPRKPAATA